MAANKAKGESTFKTMVYPVIILVVICVVCSAALAVLNDVTAPIIAANEAANPEEEYFHGESGFQSIADDQAFYLNQAGNPVVLFDKYEIAPGYMGAQEFEIVP